MSNSLTLAAVGDISFARNQNDLIREHGPKFPLEFVLDTLAKADVRFGNQESVMIPEDFPRDKLNKRALQSGDHAAESLKLAQFDILNLATNHSLDCGWRGLEHTYGCIKQAGAKPVGAGPDNKEACALQVIEKNGITLGFLGYAEEFNWTLAGGGGRVNYFTPEKAVADIQKHKGSADVLIVSLHAGLEFCDVPSRVRRDYCRQMAEAGADLILCHHSHVPQGIERHGDSVIVYSLGNFIFSMGAYLMRASPSVYHNHVVLLDIDKTGVTGWRRELFKAKDGPEGRPYPLKGDALKEAEAHYAHLDKAIQDEELFKKIWYARCQAYVKEQWNYVEPIGPDNVMDRIGWRILGLPENKHWTSGLAEMARKKYKEVSAGDFEYDRPNSVYEKDGRIF